MRRGCVAFLALAFVAVALVACGRFGFEKREAWRIQAEESCIASKVVTPSAYMSRAAEIEGPGVCGISYPFRVTAFAGGSVALTNRVVLGCPMIPEIDGWIADTLQPAAELYLGTTVTDIRAGTYSCRGRNNQPGAKLSEHAFGNAIDIMGFKLADGREISIVKGWRGATDEQDFLREVFLGACRRFKTVLGPGSDVFHYNHFHLDLARHDPRGRRAICKPILKFEPRLDPDRPAGERPAVAARPAIRPPPEPEAPLEIEDEADPFEAASQDARRPASPPARATETAARRPSAPDFATADLPRRAALPPSPPRGPSEPIPISPRPLSPQPTAPAPSPGAPLVLQPRLLGSLADD